MLAEMLGIALTWLDMPWKPWQEYLTPEEIQVWRAASTQTFHLCMDGPGSPVHGYCLYFDADEDGDVDLLDWKDIQYENL